MTTRRVEFLSGFRAEIPIVLGAFPFGMIYGVSTRSALIPASAAQSMSFLVFAGSAQFISVQLIAAGIPWVVIVVTAFIVNLRHALYSASLAPFLQRLRPAWRWLLPYFLTDEVYAVTITHYQRQEQTLQAGPDYRHWFFLGAGATLWLNWQISTAIGVFLGGAIPASWSLDFALPLTFIALVVPALKDRASTGAALIGGIGALLAFYLPYKLGLIVATFLGIAAGLWLQQRHVH